MWRAEWAFHAGMSQIEPTCACCGKSFIPSKFSKDRQRYCSALRCRKASKKASQKRWSSNNPDYFSGPVHTARVQRWREQNPDWRQCRSAARRQHPDRESTPEAKSCNRQEPAPAVLQDSALHSQLALAVGVVSVLTGSVLQEEVLAMARECLRRGTAFVPQAA